MSSSKVLKGCLTGSIALAVSAAPGCIKSKPLAPFDPVQFQQAERERSQEVQSPPMRPLPTTLEATYTGRATTQPATRPSIGQSLTEPQLRMPLHEIVQRAMANNYEVRVAGYSPAIEETRVVENEAVFDPSIFAQASVQRTDSVQGVEDDPTNFGALQEGYTYTLAGGLRQRLDTGAEYEVRYQTSKIDFDDTGAGDAQFWENQLVLEVTQPLLRDFGRTVNRARIEVARNNQRISLLDFREQLATTALDIERTYWQLVLAENELRIQERLLDRTIRTADILLKRIRQDVTRVQVSQANSSVESRYAALVRIRARIRDLSDQLKQLMNDPEFPVSSQLLILPASPPVTDPIHFDLDDQINTAMENRLELAQQQFRIDSAGIAEKVAKNALQPQLNLIGNVNVQGTDPDDTWDAADDQSDLEKIGWAIGLEFEIPIGNRAARAAYTRSRLQRQQAIEQYQGLVTEVSLDVKQAMREVQTSWEEMGATRRAAFAAEDELGALQQREDANEPLTPEFVNLKLNAQERLSEAERAHAQAIANYNFAVARLEWAKGTLLRYNNILMEEEAVPFALK